MKKCVSGEWGCGQLKPLTEFSRNKRSLDGLQARCRSCCSRYAKSNRERINETIRLKRRENPEARRKSERAWTERNPDYHKQKYHRNRDLEIARRKTWSENNRSRDNANKQRYKARKINQMGFLPTGYEEIMLDVYGDLRCMRCGSDNKIHVDHIIPASKDGLWCLNNFQYLCAFCNVSKGNRSEVDYRSLEQKREMDIYMSWLECYA